MSTTMTIRLEEDVKTRLDELAQATQRSKSYLAAEAIREYVVNNDWQIREIRTAIEEADAGDFASDADVAALARKWKAKALHPAQSPAERPAPSKTKAAKARKPRAR